MSIRLALRSMHRRWPDGARTIESFNYLLDRMKLDYLDALNRSDHWRWFLDNVIWRGLNHKNAGWKEGWC